MPVHKAEGYWNLGLDFLDSGNYIAVNRSLVRAYGLNVAVIVGELASEAKYWKRKGQLKDGWFFSTVENIERATGLNSYYQRDAIKRLQELGFVETEYKGLPRKRYFRLNCMAIIQDIAEIEGEQETAGQSKCFTQCTTSDAPSEPLATHPVDDNNNKEQQQPTTKKKERKKPAETYDSIIDGFTEDEPLRDALREFLRYKVATAKRKKSEFTNYALKQNLGKLRNLADNPRDMIAIVNQTLERGWSGFFPLKDDAPKTDRRAQYTEQQNQEFDLYSWDADQITYL